MDREDARATRFADRLLVAEAVKRACIEAALEGYERAATDGLCHEGAWEAAVDSIRRLNLQALIRGAATPLDPSDPGRQRKE